MEDGLGVLVGQGKLGEIGQMAQKNWQKIEKLCKKLCEKIGQKKLAKNWVKK